MIFTIVRDRLQSTRLSLSVFINKPACCSYWLFNWQFKKRTNHEPIVLAKQQIAVQEGGTCRKTGRKKNMITWLGQTYIQKPMSFTYVFI